MEANPKEGAEAEAQVAKAGRPRDLVLPLKRDFFDQIKAGTKLEEFRLRTPYWQKRLVGKHFDRIVLTLGYPKADDANRRLILPWQGYRECTIQHPFFGAQPVEVFAIDVSGRLEGPGGATNSAESTSL